MMGAEGAAELLRTALVERVPDKLRELEERLELEPGSLPDPKLVTAHELARLGLEDWPALYVVAQGTRGGMAVVDVTAAGAPVYGVRYVFRVFEWARGDSYAATDLGRKRLTLAVREVLLGRLGLDPDLAYTDAGTLIESYSDLAVDDAGRTIAGAYTEVELVTVETADAPPTRGTVAAAEVDTRPLPPHPAL